ncbi:MAG: DUF92 domain-containing protein [Anaerolineales bacterium]|nr:DUF92 domain-containing protein [Anaerolineales bacterium]
MNTSQLILGLILSLLIGGLAWRARSLTASGAAAAAAVGGIIFGLGGLPWAALLLTFFISSSLLSSLFSARKENLGEKFAKGARRDWGQVLANGGLGALLALFHTLDPNALWPWIAYSGAMAAVTADTWATEIGVLSGRPARLVTTGQAVEAGTSGAVSPLGLGASLGGAATIGLISWAAAPVEDDYGLLIAAVSIAGLAASLFDSLLGATVQAIYFCPLCRKETEQHPLHSCGTATARLRGWRWLNNDLVNLAASAVGAGTALLIGLLAPAI